MGKEEKSKSPMQVFQDLQQLDTKEEMISYLRELPRKDEPWPDLSKYGERDNYKLNAIIERFIADYDGTAIGQDVRNMYENGSHYETICDRLGIEYSDYEEV